MLDNLAIAYGLILLGLVFLVAEFFLPTGGVLAVLAVGELVVGLAIIFNYDTPTGLITLVALLIVLPVCMGVAMHYWPRTRIGRRLVLSGPQDDESAANAPVNLELEQLRGRYGKALSWLRPSGVAEFDGRRVDVITEGEMIEPGRWLRCTDVKSGKVVVREADRPPDLADLDTAQFT